MPAPIRRIDPDLVSGDGLDAIPAVLWRMALDSGGNVVDTDVRRAVVRSRRQLSYAEAQAAIDGGDDALVPLRAVGRQREDLERERGGLSLPVPEQEVVRDGDRYRLEFRATMPVEGWNAQISLLCGMAAAQLMLDGGWGMLRTLRPATDEEMTLATLAGSDPPEWVVEALGDLPGELQSGSGRASALERAVLDHLEALLLSGDVGENYRAVVVDHRKEGSQVQFLDPAVVATVPGEHPLGEEVSVRVDAADPVSRTLRLSVDQDLPGRASVR